MHAEDPKPFGPPETSGKCRPLDWPRRTGTVESVLREVDLAVRRARRRRLMGLAGGVMILLIASLAWPGRNELGILPESRTIVSTPRREVLADGSVVELNLGASIRVEFSAHVRSVLLERGEAHFQVAKQPGRPFVVSAGAVEVRAVGTGFSVQLNPAAVEVVVTEGRVTVERTPASTAEVDAPEIPDRTPDGSAVALVAAGNRVVVDLESAAANVRPKVEPLPATEMGDRLGWRVPRVEFTATPLAEIVATFNRHNLVQLVLADAALEKLTLSGVLRANNVAVLVRMLESAYGLKPEYRGSNQIVLHDGR